MAQQFLQLNPPMNVYLKFGPFYLPPFFEEAFSLSMFPASPPTHSPSRSLNTTSSLQLLTARTSPTLLDTPKRMSRIFRKKVVFLSP